jgi:hypothetical protein
MNIDISKPPGYQRGCRVVYRGLRFGPVAVQLQINGEDAAHIALLLIPGGGIANFEEVTGENVDTLLVIYPYYGVAQSVPPEFLEECGEIMTARLASDPVPLEFTAIVSTFLRDMIRFAEEGG